MPLPTLGDLTWLPALEHPELLAPSTHAALVAWAATEPLVGESVGVAAIDATLADTAAFVAAYHVPMTASVNCVVIQGRRGETERIAAAAIRADMRADVNGVVKRLLDVRKCSFMGLDEAVARSAMEYGGITPIGLPDGWRVLVDEQRQAPAGGRHRQWHPGLQAAAAGRAAGPLPGRRGHRGPGVRAGHRAPS